MSTRHASCSCGQLTAEVAAFHFCPTCGSTVYYELQGLEAFLAIPVGAFADPGFPSARVSVYELRKHEWVVPPPDAERIP